MTQPSVPCSEASFSSNSGSSMNVIIVIRNINFVIAVALVDEVSGFSVDLIITTTLTLGYSFAIPMNAALLFCTRASELSGEFAERIKIFQRVKTPRGEEQGASSSRRVSAQQRRTAQ